MTGAVQFAAGNEAEAEKAFRLLAAEVPETGDYLLAQFYRRTGREREYRVQLEETVQANPLLSAARVELAEQYAGEKNTAGLKQLLRQPNNRAEAEAFSYIEAMRALARRPVRRCGKIPVGGGGLRRPPALSGDPHAVPDRPAGCRHAAGERQCAAQAHTDAGMHADCP